MMFNKLKSTKGAIPMMEYVVLFVILIAGIIVMQKYITRSMSGKWKAAGDTFAFGIQYQAGDGVGGDSSGGGEAPGGPPADNPGGGPGGGGPFPVLP